MPRFPLAALLLLVSVPAAAAAPDVTGLWLTDDGKGVVDVQPCGQKMCGKIVRVLDRGPGVPTTDVNNPVASRRNRPIIGLQVLSGFKAGLNEWKDGRAYDPKKGSSYSSSMRLNRDGSLRITGCVLFVCQSVRWTRTR